MASRDTPFVDGKLRINFCEEADMRVLPNVGRAAAEQMSEFRDMHGNITKENVLNIPNVKVSKQFLQMVDFTRNPAYSSVPCRTNLEKQEDKQRSTPSADCWEYQSAPSDASSKTPDSWSKSTRQSSQSSVGTQGSRPAYSSGGTPPCAMPVKPDFVVPSGPPNTGKKLYSRVTSTRKPTCSSQSVIRHRPAYSPGGTPARRNCPVRRPAYSPGGTPARSPVRTAAYSPEGTPARRRSTARRPAYSPGGTPACNKSPTQTPALQLMFSSDDSSSEDSSSDESELVEADFAQERFLLASQAPEENLYDWADRLRVLAFKAFKGKSYSYINRLSVKQFCLECLDQKAGRYALDHNPETMDDALDYIKQCFMTYRQKQSQMSEASRPRDVTTDGQNIVQSQQNQLPAESPVCDSHITKSPVCDSNIIKSPVCDSLITRSPVSDPILSTGMLRDSVNKEQQKPEKHNKSRKAKKAKAKKRKATREQSEPSSLAGNSKNLSEVIALQTDLLANSSRVDEGKQYVLDENTTAKDIPLEEEVLVKATDEQQPGVYGILVHPSRPKYLVAMQLFESVSSIPDVTFDSAEMSLTEQGAVAPNALAITEQRCLYTKHRTITTLKKEESVSPCWNISEVTEGATEEVKQSSTTETVNEEARFLEIERIIAEEIAHGTSVKQSSTTAADEENLFTEIEQIIEAEMAYETSVAEISSEAIITIVHTGKIASESPVDETSESPSEISCEKVMHPEDKLNNGEIVDDIITVGEINMQAKLVPDIGSCLESSFITKTDKNEIYTAREGVQTVPAGKEIKMEADASIDRTAAQDERKSGKASISSQGEINMKADASIDNTACQDDNPDGELTIEDGISLEAGASVDNFAGTEADASVDQDERKSDKSSISSQGEINMKADASVNNTAGQDDNPDGELMIEEGISLEAGASIDNFCQSPTRTVVKGHLKNKPLGKISGDTKIEADAFVDNFAGKETNMEADASVNQDDTKSDKSSISSQGEINMKSIASETATWDTPFTNEAVFPFCEIAREAALTLDTDIALSEYSCSIEYYETQGIATAKSEGNQCGDDDKEITQTELMSDQNDQKPDLGSCRESTLLADVGQSCKIEKEEEESQDFDGQITINYDFADAVQPLEGEQDRQLCHEMQLEIIQHLGLNLQSGDDDHIGAEVEETIAVVEGTGATDSDANLYEEQGSGSGCSGPKQWDPGGSLAGGALQSQ